MSAFNSWDAPSGASNKRISLSEGFINIDLGQDEAASPGDEGDFDSFVNNRGGFQQSQTHQPQHFHDPQFSAGVAGRVSGGDSGGFQDVDFSGPQQGAGGRSTQEQDLAALPTNLFNGPTKPQADRGALSSNSSGNNNTGFGFSSNQAALNTANSRLDGIFNSNSGGGKRGVDPSTSSMQGELLCRVSTKPLFFHLDCREGDLAVFRTQEDLRKGPPFAKKYLKLEYNYRCTEIKLKEYGKSFLYHFSLEEIMDYGPSLKMKFACESMKRSLLENLRSAIHRYVRDRRVKRKNEMLQVRAAQVEGGLEAGGQAGHMKQQNQQHRVAGRYADEGGQRASPPRRASQDLGFVGLPTSPPVTKDPPMHGYDDNGAGGGGGG
ncbi:hypothetical protein TrRE_jg2273, partial [Triparma retinervis]